MFNLLITSSVITITTRLASSVTIVTMRRHRLASSVIIVTMRRHCLASVTIVAMHGRYQFNPTWPIPFLASPLHHFHFLHPELLT